MKSLQKDCCKSCYSPSFSHIYIEKKVREHPRTERILAKFPQSKVILIDHYKDVFCRSRQDYGEQHRAQKLILAAKHGRLLYEGAPVCQNFGQNYFYYTSCIMNCIYDCEYCYLKGMYPSGNIVAFVNLEDIFAETEAVLKRHPVYLCVSYDTDLMALESVAGYAKEWVEFADRQKDLKIEIRTKCAGKGLWKALKVLPSVVYAFTLSPQAVIDAYEHHTPSLNQRISCVGALQKAGFPVRLCFDPMIYCSEWQRHYDRMIDIVFDTIEAAQIEDVSVGTFRVSQDYLKKMRKCEPFSAAVQFPFQNDGGVYHYPDKLMEHMEQHLVRRLKEKIPEEKIFLWGKQR